MSAKPRSGENNDGLEDTCVTVVIPRLLKAESHQELILQFKLAEKRNKWKVPAPGRKGVLMVPEKSRDDK